MHFIFSLCFILYVQHTLHTMYTAFSTYTVYSNGHGQDNQNLCAQFKMRRFIINSETGIETGRSKISIGHCTVMSPAQEVVLRSRGFRKHGLETSSRSQLVDWDVETIATMRSVHQTQHKATQFAIFQETESLARLLSSSPCNPRVIHS